MLFGLSEAPRFPVDTLVDNLAEKGPGHSFLTDPRNQLNTVRDWLFARLHADPNLRHRFVRLDENEEPVRPRTASTRLLGRLDENEKSARPRTASTRLLGRLDEGEEPTRPRTASTRLLGRLHEGEESTRTASTRLLGRLDEGEEPARPRTASTRLLGRLDEGEESTRTASTRLLGRQSAIGYYLHANQRFLRLLAVLVYMGSGLPPRRRELIGVSWCNQETARNLYVYQHQVMIVTGYYKSQWRVGTRPVARFLPPAVGEVLVRYLIYVPPLLRFFHHCLQTPPPRGFLWADGGTA